MVTNQVMIRNMGDYLVTQRTIDGYFDSNELLKQWNSCEGHTFRKMDDFLTSKQTSEFIDALITENSFGENSLKVDNQVIKRTVVRKKGKTGRPKEQIWMHPYLFIKFSMWINPRFEVKVIKFVYDEMIKYRNEAGDAYRELCFAVSKIVPKSETADKIRRVSEAINFVVFNRHEKSIRNQFGDEVYQKDLASLEKKITDLITEGFLRNYEDVIDYLRKLWRKRYEPSF